MYCSVPLPPVVSAEKVVVTPGACGATRLAERLTAATRAVVVVPLVIANGTDVVASSSSTELVALLTHTAIL